MTLNDEVIYQLTPSVAVKFIPCKWTWVKEIVHSMTLNCGHWMGIEWELQTGNEGLIYQLTLSVAAEFISCKWTCVKVAIPE